MKLLGRRKILRKNIYEVIFSCDIRKAKYCLIVCARQKGGGERGKTVVFRDEENAVVGILSYFFIFYCASKVSN